MQIKLSTIKIIFNSRRYLLIFSVYPILEMFRNKEQLSIGILKE